MDIGVLAFFDGAPPAPSDGVVGGDGSDAVSHGVLRIEYERVCFDDPALVHIGSWAIDRFGTQDEAKGACVVARREWDRRRHILFVQTAIVAIRVVDASGDGFPCRDGLRCATANEFGLDLFDLRSVDRVGNADAPVAAPKFIDGLEYAPDRKFPFIGALGLSFAFDFANLIGFTSRIRLPLSLGIAFLCFIAIASHVVFGANGFEFAFLLRGIARFGGLALFLEFPSVPFAFLEFIVGRAHIIAVLASASDALAFGIVADLSRCTRSARSDLVVFAYFRRLTIAIGVLFFVFAFVIDAFA